MARSTKKKLPALTPRSAVAMAHSLRGGAGAGKHHTRTRDVETGRSRKPKYGGKRGLYERENPLSGLSGLHAVAHRITPSRKYGSEFTQSYGVVKMVAEPAMKKSGQEYMTYRRRVDWKNTAREFLADYDMYAGDSVYDRIFAIDESGKEVDLSLADIVRMATE